MKRFVLAVTTTMFSGTVLAAPVYLDCTISSGKENFSYSVKVDESSGKITHTHSDGSAFNADGFFAVNTISYQARSITDLLTITQKYEINRTDLTVTKTTVMEATDPELAARVPGNRDTMGGKCSIVKSKDRKI